MAYRNETLAQLREVAAAAYSGSPAVKTVLLALLDVGSRVAPYGAMREAPADVREHELTTTWSASGRRLAELAGVSRQTVQRALAELETGRYIVRVLRRGQAADVWALGPSLLLLCEGHLEWLCEEVSVFGTINHNHDLSLLAQNRIPWPAHLLTPKHETCYLALGAEPVSVAALAGQLGCKWETAKARLDALAGCGLAEVTKAGWVRGPGSLADAAAQMDAAGRAQAKQAQHDAERAARQSQEPAEWNYVRLTQALSPAELAGVDAWMRAQTCPHCGSAYRPNEKGRLVFDVLGGWWPERCAPSFVRPEAERAWGWYCPNRHCMSAVLITAHGVVYRKLPTAQNLPDGRVALRSRPWRPDVQGQRSLLARLGRAWSELDTLGQLVLTKPGYTWTSQTDRSVNHA
jgi:DNA-binding MarR family transcriptional regulator